jgi:hypothetical protein
MAARDPQGLRGCLTLKKYLCPSSACVRLQGNEVWFASNGINGVALQTGGDGAPEHRFSSVGLRGSVREGWFCDRDWS